MAKTGRRSPVGTGNHRPRIYPDQIKENGRKKNYDPWLLGWSEEDEADVERMTNEFDQMSRYEERPAGEAED